MIPFGKPYFPPIDHYQAMMHRIWANGWFTNQGPLAEELESSLKQYLHTPHLLFIANGTLALQFIIRAFGRGGEVITTPFSYVATTSAIVWEGCTPVFADIDPLTLNIDPKSVEQAITPRTTAILATHVFGNPCNVDALHQIAQKHGLALLFDAAHCFGARWQGKSLVCYGDAAICSLHATKVYHTVEGGLVYCPQPDTLAQIDLMRNFGHDGPERFSGLGINGKNSEVHAAMGLVNLPLLTQVIAERRAISERYDALLAHLPVRKPTLDAGLEYNYAYYPLIFENEQAAEHAMQVLAEKGIGTRRYFHPMLYNLPYVQRHHPLPVAEALSGCILCLPLYNGLVEHHQQSIAAALEQAFELQLTGSG
jgi:dTDP-4-amino-4,6-dideoxygalactose transaminase